MFCNFQTKRSIISKDALVLPCLPFSFSFEGVKVEATGKEKIEYLMVSFALPSSSTGVSGTLKASEMAAVGFHHVYDLRTNILFFLLSKRNLNH
jgi:hypothetical protein